MSPAASVVRTQRALRGLLSPAALEMAAEQSRVPMTRLLRLVDVVLAAAGTLPPADRGVEQWRQIEGHPAYWVSNLGRVWSEATTSILAPYGGKRTPRVLLNGTNCSVARVVWETFLNESLGPRRVRVVDESRGPRLDNLELAARRQAQ